MDNKPTLLLFDCNRVNRNGRIYPKDIVEKALNKEQIENKSFLLYSAVDENGNAPLSNVIGVLTDYFWDNNKCYGNFELISPTKVEDCFTCGTGSVEYSKLFDADIVTDFTLDKVVQRKNEK